MAITAEPAVFDADPPFLLQHPRARRGGRWLPAWIRPEPPRVVAPHLEPVLETEPPTAPEPLPAGATPVEFAPLEFAPIGLAPGESLALPVEPLRFEPPLHFEPVEIAGIELPPVPDIEPTPVERVEIAALAGEPVPVQPLPTVAPLPAVEPLPVATAVAIPAVAVPRRRGWSRRVVGGLLSAAAYLAGSLMLLAAGPVYLVLSDRQDVVRWSNDLLDLVARW